MGPRPDPGFWKGIMWGSVLAAALWTILLVIVVR